MRRRIYFSIINAHLRRALSGRNRSDEWDLGTRSLVAMVTGTRSVNARGLTRCSPHHGLKTKRWDGHLTLNTLLTYRQTATAILRGVHTVKFGINGMLSRRRHSEARQHCHDRNWYSMDKELNIVSWNLATRHLKPQAKTYKLNNLEGKSIVVCFRIFCPQVALNLVKSIKDTNVRNS